MMNNQKILKLVVIISVIVAIFIAGFLIYKYWWPTKIYRNEEYGFMFKYPSQYQLTESELATGDFKVYLLLSPVEQTARGITVMQNKNASRIIEEMKTSFYSSEVWEEKMVFIDGIEGKSILTEAVKGPTPIEITIVEKDGVVYRFDWLSDVILSTFRFLD